MSALIVEPRNHAALEKVIDNIHTGLDLPISLFHGMENRELARAIQEKYPGLRLREMPVRNLDAHQYSSLLMQPEFWAEAAEQSAGRNVLVFQTDAGVCDASKKEENIARFRATEAFDLVGSPGNFRGMPFVNGGFSSRNPKTMQRLLAGNAPQTALTDWLDHWKPKRNVANEDHWFSKACTRDSDCRMAHGEEAELFACCTRQSACDQVSHIRARDSSLFGFHAYERGGSADACRPNRSSLCAFANEIKPLQRTLTPDEISKLHG